MQGDAAFVLVVLAIEASIGYPQWLYARIRHPVVWVGALIGTLDRRWNQGCFRPSARRVLGVVVVLLLVALAWIVGHTTERAFDSSIVGVVALALIASSGIAQRSLYIHVRDVLRALQRNDLEQARIYVARIVGRDTAGLSHAQVAAAALESLSESFNDAVVAPTFWLFVGELPGLLTHKFINTADSMIGHMEERWRVFGWAAARTDDVMNFVPARIAGCLLAASATRGFRIMLRDAHKHASPNAGWPEAALAGGLGVILGGPAQYEGVVNNKPTFGDGALPSAIDLTRGLRLYVRACGLLWLLIAMIAIAQVVL